MKFAAKIILNSKLSSLQILYIHGGSEMGITKVKELLPILFKITTEQIYIDSFKLVEQDFNLIFSYAYRVKHLCITNWEVSNLGEDFKLPKKQKYKMKTLDLFWTCLQNNEEYLDERKTEVLFNAIKNSRLKESLQEVHLWDKDFNEEELEDIIHTLELDVSLKLDKITPKPLS